MNQPFLKQLSLPKACKDVCHFIARHWLILLIKVAPILMYIFIGSMILITYELPDSYRAFYLLGFASIYPIVIAPLVGYLSRATGTPFDRPVNAALWHQLFVLFLISQTITTLGYFLLIIPGIYLSVRLSLSEFYIILNNSNWINAIKKSWQTTEPIQWPLMASAGLLMTLGLFADIQLLECRNTSCLTPWLIEALNTSLSAVLMITLTVFYFRIYSLTEQKEPSLG